MFDKLIVAVLVNSAKTPLFTVRSASPCCGNAASDMPNVEVDSFNGLTVSFAKQKKATVMVRGLRAVTDFENEIQLAHTNYAMMPEIETCSWLRPSSGVICPPPSCGKPPTMGRMFPGL